MIKSIVKKILLAPVIKQRVSSLYFPRSSLSAGEIESCLAHDNIWYLSQKKSGTTYLCNSLAFYNAHRYGIDGVNFGNIEKGGVGRAVARNAEVFKGLLQYKAVTSDKCIVHTHLNIADCTPRIFMCSTRHPLDYAVSAFHFLVKNRRNRQNVSIDEALPRLIKDFCGTHVVQREIAIKSEKVVKITYESLVLENEKSLRAVIKSLYGSCDEAALSFALKQSDIENLKKFETEQGFAAIASAKTFTESHFVRSGKVGEGREFFSDRQIETINKIMKSAGIPADGSFDF